MKRNNPYIFFSPCWLIETILDADPVIKSSWILLPLFILWRMKASEDNSSGRGCKSGGDDFVCSVVILALSKSFGRLLDEIIAVMMVNYLIVWKSAELRLASENRREQERYWTGKPLSCKYYIHMIISLLIDDLNFFLWIAACWTIQNYKNRRSSNFNKKMTSNTLAVVFVVVRLLLFVSSEFWKIF